MTKRRNKKGDEVAVLVSSVGRCTCGQCPVYVRDVDKDYLLDPDAPDVSAGELIVLRRKRYDVWRREWCWEMVEAA